MSPYIKITALFLLAILVTSCKIAYFTKSEQAETYTVNHLVAEDTSISNYYLPFKRKMESEMNREIGYSETNLLKSRAEAETTAGNFFVDALLTLGKKLDPTVQLSLATKGGIRAEIKKGPITVGHIFELMPFENTITILEISGKDLQIMTEYIAKTGGQPIAGFTMKIKDGKPTEVLINDKELDLNSSYKLVTYDYLANGGDYVEGFQTPITRNDTDIIVRNGLIKYIEQLTKEGKTINTHLDGRVTIVK